MPDIYRIAGYCRISVDDEKEGDSNVSIENQKAILSDYVRTNFPAGTLTFFEDRDRSGYTFEQREAYQKMRKGLVSHRYDILVVKDFSRFSRRNSRGLVELEDLRDAGVRIISVGDGIDFPNDDDWLKIQFQFLLNEMPVTDTSKKVRNVIHRRQMDGKWICAAPYGYTVNRAQAFEIVPAEAEIVRQVFRLYNQEGWGYKKIADYLTDQGIPTPRMGEQMRREAEGKASHREIHHVWAIATVQGILDNDFYIGTLRQGKTARSGINGRDVPVEASDQIVIENHHPPIVEYRTFAATRALREKRSRSHYRGVKKNDNVYTGFLVCGDCGSPMFATSRAGLPAAYTCGTYHRRGVAGCSSHHIRTERLDSLLKAYLRRVYENASDLVARLNDALSQEDDYVAETEASADHLAALAADLQEELRVTKRQRIRELMRKPGQEALIEETYDAMEAELEKKLQGLNRQLDLLADRRNTVIRVNRTAKTALELFREVLEKPRLERPDLELLIRKITVYEDHLEVQLQSDIDTLFHTESAENAVNFKFGTENMLHTVIQSSRNHADRVFRVRVVRDGDPLEIYTDRDGEVIFKKYSPLGEMSAFAAQLCESLHKSSGYPVAICDRESIIAAAGAQKRELLEKRLSRQAEALCQERQMYQWREGQPRIPAAEGNALTAAVIAPVIAEGDLSGSVLFLATEQMPVTGEAEYKLAMTAAGFLSRQMES